MSDVYKSSKFIIGFLVMVLVIESAFGEDASEKFCLVILLSMIIFNYKNFAEFLKGFASVSSNNDKKHVSTIHTGVDGRPSSGGSLKF